MAQQNINLGSDSTGADGDTNRTAWVKAQANFTELFRRAMSNMLINCGAPINARGFAGGALAAGAYGYDRWKAGSGGCNIAINSASGVFAHNSGPLQQIIEFPQGAWGRPLTVSVEEPSQNLAISLGGAVGNIAAGSGRRSVTLTPTGSGHMTLQITPAAGATYLRPKVERADSSSDFDFTLDALNLLLCQRYCETGNFFQTVYGAAGMQANTTIPFKATKRDVPAMNVVGANYSNASGATFFNTNRDSSCFQITIGSAGAGTVQTAWRAEAEL